MESCILIGNNAQATQNYELVIRAGGEDLCRKIMTHEQYEELSSLLLTNKN